MALDPYGSDVSTFPDLDMTGGTIADKNSIAECTLRRWTMQEATLDYDPEAGFDLRDLLNDDLSQSDLLRYATFAAIEAEKDERVKSMAVELTLDASRFRLSIRARGVLIDDRTFTLTASIDQISAEILAVV